MEKTWLDRVPAMVTLITSLSVVLSLIFEWGYFTAIGGPWRTFLVIKDYVVLAVEWMPLGVAAGITASLFLTALIKKALPEIEVDDQGRLIKFPLYLSLWISVPLTSLIIVFLFFMGYRNEWVCAGIFALAGCWLSFARYVLRKRWISEEMVGVPGIAAFVFLPPLMFLTYTAGLTSGELATLLPTNVHGVSVKGSEKVSTVAILRSVERGILVRHIDRQVNEFVPWSEISGVYQLRQLPRVTPRVCSWMEFEWCADYKLPFHEENRSSTK